MMAPIAIFIYFQAPLQSALQALNKPGAALINTLIGSSVKLILIYWLASKPEMGIHGAVFAINVNIVLVTLLHWNSVVRLLNSVWKAVILVKLVRLWRFPGFAVTSSCIRHGLQPIGFVLSPLFLLVLLYIYCSLLYFV